MANRQEVNFICERCGTKANVFVDYGSARYYFCDFKCSYGWDKEKPKNRQFPLDMSVSIAAEYLNIPNDKIESLIKEGILDCYTLTDIIYTSYGQRMITGISLGLYASAENIQVNKGAYANGNIGLRKSEPWVPLPLPTIS